MESAINLASGFPNTDIDLSEQYVLSCLPYGGSCNGGWTDDALESIINTGSIGNFINGVPLESCMPYQAVDWIPCDDKCENWDYFTDPPQPDNVLWQLESWGADHSLENDNPNDLDIIKTYIMEKGPMSASMYASGGFSSYWDSHHDPNDWYYEEDHGYTNHAVLLVGWKDDPEVTNGGFFRLKNSWGTDFGYGGFFNVAYGGLDIGEIVRWCKTPDWPEAIKGPGPGKPALHVFANFDYEPEYPKLGDEIEFYDSSIGNVALWEWDFDGDGVIDSNLKKPKHRFYEEGEYEVSLTVWSSAGLNNTITRIVEVREIWPPIAIASPEYYSGDDSVVYFDARYSYDVDGEIVSYHWDFDDGKTSDSAYLTHEFSTVDKIYNVTLTVTDDEGATSMTNCDIRIDQNMPPETEATFAVGADKDKWFRGPQEVTLVVNDWTGVYKLYYRVDDDDFNVIS
jgi:PKD repeat protein